MVLTVLPPKRRKPCLWAAGGCGALLFAGGFVCVFVAFPALVDWQVDVNYDLWNKESEGYKNFVSCDLVSQQIKFKRNVIFVNYVFERRTPAKKSLDACK